MPAPGLTSAAMPHRKGEVVRRLPRSSVIVHPAGTRKFPLDDVHDSPVPIAVAPHNRPRDLLTVQALCPCLLRSSLSSPNYMGSQAGWRSPSLPRQRERPTSHFLLPSHQHSLLPRLTRNPSGAPPNRPRQAQSPSSGSSRRGEMTGSPAPAWKRSSPPHLPLKLPTTGGPSHEEL